MRKIAKGGLPKFRALLLILRYFSIFLQGHLSERLRKCQGMYKVTPCIEKQQKPTYQVLVLGQVGALHVGLLTPLLTHLLTPSGRKVKKYLNNIQARTLKLCR